MHFSGSGLCVGEGFGAYLTSSSDFASIQYTFDFFRLEPNAINCETLQLSGSGGLRGIWTVQWAMANISGASFTNIFPAGDDRPASCNKTRKTINGNRWKRQKRQIWFHKLFTMLFPHQPKNVIIRWGTTHRQLRQTMDHSKLFCESNPHNCSTQTHTHIHPGPPHLSKAVARRKMKGANHFPNGSNWILDQSKNKCLRAIQVFIG